MLINYNNILCEAEINEIIFDCVKYALFFSMKLNTFAGKRF